MIPFHDCLGRLGFVVRIVLIGIIIELLLSVCLSGHAFFDSHGRFSFLLDNCSSATHGIADNMSPSKLNPADPCRIIPAFNRVSRVENDFFEKNHYIYYMRKYS